MSGRVAVQDCCRMDVPGHREDCHVLLETRVLAQHRITALERSLFRPAARSAWSPDYWFPSDGA